MARIISNKIAVSIEGVGEYPKGVLRAVAIGPNISIYSTFGNADVAFDYPYTFYRDKDDLLLGANQSETITKLNEIFTFNDTDGLTAEISRTSQEGNVIVSSLIAFTPVLSKSIDLKKGVYRVLVEYMWAGSSTNDDIITKLFVDGNEPYSPTLPYMHREEPKDSNGNLIGLSESFSDQIYQFGFNYQFNVDIDKSVPFQVQFATSRNGRAVAVYFPKILIYRTQ